LSKLINQLILRIVVKYIAGDGVTEAVEANDDILAIHYCAKIVEANKHGLDICTR